MNHSLKQTEPALSDSMQDQTEESHHLSIRERAQAAVTRGLSLAYLDGLNPEQRQAVETTEGPVLVLAGAGTGKTRVLTTRIAHLIATRKARPFEILAVTFTNKAAREMQQRVGQTLGPLDQGMQWLGTFHSIGAKILRRHSELVGLESNFTILGTDDQLRLLKQLIQAENIDEKRWPARQLAGMIDNWKNRGLFPDNIPAGEAGAFAQGKGAMLYTEYQKRLKALNAADFGDLLLECLRLWKEYPDILQHYQSRFRYILVDEYQDTNVAQYLWLRLLAQMHRNICCVGDDDQSIYGWRGAEVDNILRFEYDFPGAQVIRLERNYRSTGHILAAATQLIAKNQSRLGKTLHTDDEDGEKVSITGAWDSEEEARLIGEEVESLQYKGISPSEIAILVRISAQMREIEDRLVTLGIPYKVIGGPRFYERQEIRDALAYMRCTVSRADDLAFERIANVPKRGLGDSTLQKLHLFARTQNVSLMEAARLLIETDELKPKTRTSLRDLLTCFDRWTKSLSGDDHAEVAQQILEESGYTDMWKKEKTPDVAGRLENLKELIHFMEEFPDLPSFLEHVSLVMEASDGESEARVSLMTLHAAKGLEFECVFLPGWEEGLLPNQRALDENGRIGLEEERRLAHVGLTRACKRAFIYFATNRRIRGLWNSTIPSRFLDDLPDDHVEIIEAPISFHNTTQFNRLETGYQSDYGTPGWNRARNNGSRAEDYNRGHFNTPSPSGYPASSRIIEGKATVRSKTSAQLISGNRVFHVKFGNGTVTDTDGNKITVDFDKAGRKTVIENFLELLEN